MKISEIVSENDLKNVKKFGIYKISYNNSDRIYIGSTIQSFYLRWIQHVWEFKKGCHGNSKMTNIVNKYGLECLCFEIVEVVENKKEILKKEQYYIDLYNTYRGGLNCSPFAHNSVGCVRSEETKVKYFYNIVSKHLQNGTYIATYKSMKDAAKETGTDYITLSNACNGKTRLANGFQWRKGNSKDNIPPVKRKGQLSIYQYDNDGIFLKEWNSIKEISKHFNRPQNSFSTAIKRGRIIENCYWSKKRKDKIEFRKIGKGKKEIFDN